MSKPLFIGSILLSACLLSNAATAQICDNTNTRESTPTSRYTFHAGGTVSDTQTGLIWKRCLEGQTFSDSGTSDNYVDDQCIGSATPMNWQAALSQAQTANSTTDSGYSDWRVPNLKELESIVEYCQVNPASNMEVFPGTVADRVWSSSPMTFPKTGAQFIDFTFGSSKNFSDWSQRDNAYFVRLVCAGQ